MGQVLPQGQLDLRLRLSRSRVTPSPERMSRFGNCCGASATKHAANRMTDTASAARLIACGRQAEKGIRSPACEMHSDTPS